MKKPFLLFAAASLAALVWVWQGVQPAAEPGPATYTNEVGEMRTVPAVDLFRISEGDGVRKSPPDLTLILGEMATKAWQGTYEWSWPGAETMEGICVCTASPMDDVTILPSLKTAAWDRVELKFEGRAPDELTVTAYGMEDALMAAGEPVELAEGRFLELGADGGRGKVYEIVARWDTVEGSGGSGWYAFAVPEPERGGLPCGGGIEEPEGETTASWFPGE